MNERVKKIKEMLTPEIERRYEQSLHEVMEELHERVANGELTLEEVVRLAIQKSYWRGAMDVLEIDPEKISRAIN